MASDLAGISPPITSFCLSLTMVGGSRTMGLTNTVLEVEGISEGRATYLMSAKCCTFEPLNLH